MNKPRHYEDYRCPGCVDCVRRHSLVDCMAEIDEDGVCANKVGECVSCGCGDVTNKHDAFGEWRCAKHAEEMAEAS